MRNQWLVTNAILSPASPKDQDMMQISQPRELMSESVDDIMQELLIHERKGIELYRRLLKLSQDCSIALEEFAREKIRNEEMHVSEIEKMLRRRGDA